MGYDTNFCGGFILDKPLTKLHKLYLETFSRMRHMKRNNSLLPPDPILSLLKMKSVGVEGEYFVGSKLAKIPSWTPETNQYYTKEFQDKVTLLLAVQKYRLNNIDQNIFFNIIQYLADDIAIVDFEQEHNLQYLSFSNEDSFGFSTRNKSIIDYNKPAKTQPGLWCQWVPNNDGTKIIWDEGEKFYCYVEWLAYLQDNFLRPWGYNLSGSVKYQGEDKYDSGTITVKGNDITLTLDRCSHCCSDCSSDEC